VRSGVWVAAEVVVFLRPCVLMLLPAFFVVIADARNEQLGDGSSTSILDPLEVPERVGEVETVGRDLVESDAVLRRIGNGPVRSAGISGLTWVTVDPIDVTVRIRPARDGLRLRRLPAGLWPELTETLALAGAVAGTPPVPWVDVATAGRAAAGTLLVLSDASGHTALRITGSATALTSGGTKVELVGRVRR